MSAVIRVNGTERAFASPSIPELLAAEGVPAGTRFVAVAVNETVIPRARWNEVALKPGDAVEIVKPVQGG
jgi:sulfur carrier protein